MYKNGYDDHNDHKGRWNTYLCKNNLKDPMGRKKKKTYKWETK